MGVASADGGSNSGDGGNVGVSSMGACSGGRDSVEGSVCGGGDDRGGSM